MILRLITCLAFLSLLVSTYAQDWSPIVKERIAHYAYAHDLDGPIIQTIWVDSSSFNDSILYLNRVAKLYNLKKDIRFGDGDLGSPTMWANALQNQGQFMQEEIHNLGNEIYRFIGQTDYTLELQEDSSFWFGTEDTLRVVSIISYQDTVLDVQDSMKRFQLSNGFEIITSKNHGIVKFPAQFDSLIYFNLVGFQDDSAHRILFEYLDMHPGDFIHYSYSKFVKQFTSCCLQGVIRKFEVIERREFSDFIEFKIKGGDIGFYQSDLLSINERAFYHEQAFESSIKVERILLNNRRVIPVNVSLEFYGMPMRIEDVRVFSTDGFSSGRNGTYKPGNGDTLNYSDGFAFLYWSKGHPELISRYGQFSRFESSEEFELIKSRIGDRLYNVVAGSEPEIIASGALPYPNPSQSYLLIPKSWEGPFRIIDASSREYEIQWRDEHTLNTEHLNSGLYILVSKNKDFRFIKK